MGIVTIEEEVEIYLLYYQVDEVSPNINQENLNNNKEVTNVLQNIIRINEEVKDVLDSTIKEIVR